jgi:pimeloyl-ACP methyl ester carboxylesterase
VEPASGGSERPRAVPLHLVGHSLGGATSILAAAALGPATVVTLGTNARKDSLRRLLGEEAFERARTEGSFLFDAGDGVLRPLTRAFVSDLERQDVLGAAEHLACPLLVVHGDHDSLVPLDAARELASCARADLAVVPGGEHLLSSRADRASVRAAVLAFLARQG